MQINSTELAGLLAFVPAALGCCLAAARTSPRRQRKGWGLLAIIYALLTVEVLASTRHRIRGAVNDWLITDHIYPDRRPAQAAVILLLIVIGVIAARFVLRSVPTRRLRLATYATAAVLLLFIVESVSLHAVDALLYRPVGPVMLIGWLWLAGGLTAAGAAARP